MMNLTPNATKIHDCLFQVPRKEKIDFGIILPVKQQTIHAVQLASKENWIHPVLLGTKKEVELFNHLSGLRAESMIADNPMDAFEIAMNEGKISGVIHEEIDIHLLFTRVLKIPSFKKGWLSHISLMYISDKLFLLSDAAVAFAPNLEQKVKIVENAIHVARKINFIPPKVAMFAAVETISTDMQVGMHDAIIAKMGERGQFGNAMVEGPLAFDLAISSDAAKKKKISHPVAGNANVMIAPNLEVGSGLYKALITLGGAASASVVVGGAIPIALPSRADTFEGVLHSILFACVVAS